jgi:hypothetical protein
MVNVLQLNRFKNEILFLNNQNNTEPERSLVDAEDPYFSSEFD